MTISFLTPSLIRQPRRQQSSEKVDEKMVRLDEAIERKRKMASWVTEDSSEFRPLRR